MGRLHGDRPRAAPGRCAGRNALTAAPGNAPAVGGDGAVAGAGESTVPTRLLRMPLRPQELALIAVTAVWGSTFLLVHWAMEYSGPWFFVGLRFLVAAAISAVIFRRSLRGMTWADVGAGAAVGVMIYGGYGLQTLGLQTIDSSTSAFLTALYVPMVPFAQWLIFRHRPPAMAFAGAALAFAGLLLIAGPDAFTLSSASVRRPPSSAPSRSPGRSS